MTTQNGLFIAVVPLIAVAALAGWLGLRWTVALPMVFLLPVVATIVLFTITNEDALVSEQFDEPGLVGMMLGTVIATVSAPLWAAGFLLGRRLRRG